MRHLLKIDELQEYLIDPKDYKDHQTDPFVSAWIQDGISKKNLKLGYHKLYGYFILDENNDLIWSEGEIETDV